MRKVERVASAHVLKISSPNISSGEFVDFEQLDFH